jgi:hypothetical protein
LTQIESFDDEATPASEHPAGLFASTDAVISENNNNGNTSFCINSFIRIGVLIR